MYTYMYIYIYAYMYNYNYTCIYVHIYIYICMYICVHIGMCAYHSFAPGFLENLGLQTLELVLGHVGHPRRVPETAKEGVTTAEILKNMAMREDLDKIVKGLRKEILHLKRMHASRR